MVNVQKVAIAAKTRQNAKVVAVAKKTLLQPAAKMENVKKAGIVVKTMLLVKKKAVANPDALISD